MKSFLKIMLELEQQPSFAKMFRLTCNNGQRIASEYWQNGQIKKVTYHEMGIITQRVAYNLQKTLGKDKQGHYVGLHLDNCPEWPYLFWGMLMAGYNPILLDFRASQETLHHLLEQAAAVAIITNATSTLKDGLMQVNKNEFMTSLIDSADDWQPEWAKYVALCTSGTTASSKVFVYEEQALVLNVTSGRRNGAEGDGILTSDDPMKLLAFIPFYHIFGLYCLVLWPLLLGNTIVYLKDRSPLTLVEACRDHKINQLYGVPLLWNNLVAKMLAKLAQQPLYKRVLFKSLQKLSMGLQYLALNFGRKLAKQIFFRRLHQNLLGLDMTVLISGGAYLSPQTLRFLVSLGYPVLCGYGMTEAGIIGMETGLSFKRMLRSSVGQPFLGVTTRFMPMQENAGEVGELHIKANSLHTGRLEDGKMIEPVRTDDGWLATGDLGKLDENGRLYLQGRCKDTIITETGENVYPDEVEDFFRGIVGVEEFSVMGLHNTHQGEDIVLAVNIGKNRSNREFLERFSDTVYRINSKMPLYKRISKVLLSHQPLPTTTSMKTQRQRLKSLLESNSWPYSELPIKKSNSIKKDEVSKEKDVNDEMKEAVRTIFAQVLGKPVAAISDHSHFIEDLGGDSLGAIELANLLEKKFQVFIPDSVLIECTNVQEITEAVLHRLNNSGQTNERLKVIHSKPKRQTISQFENSREYKAFATLMKQAGDYNPYFVRHDSTVRDTSIVDNKEVINLGSYNYLGLSGHPRTVEAAQQAVAMYGTSASGSRLLTGEKTLYRQLEKDLAEWKQVEDSLILVSGHATNVTFVGNFCNENDLIIYDALSHNSIEQGCRLSRSDSKAFPHNDFHALENILQQTRDYYEKILIIVEGVYSMDGDIAPIPEFVKLKHKYQAFLMVDEAHSTCVIGKRGKGVDEHFELAPEDIDIRMGTLSKGLGSCGGYLAGKKALIEYLRYNLPGFVFSVGISPASAAAALEAIRVVIDEPTLVEKLHSNIAFFMEQAHKHNFNTCLAGPTAIIPIMIGDEEAAFALSKLLKDNGVCVPPAIYPAVPKGKARLRFCVTSEHKHSQLAQALDLLKNLADKHQIKLPPYQPKLASAS